MDYEQLQALEILVLTEKRNGNNPPDRIPDMPINMFGARTHLKKWINTYFYFNYESLCYLLIPILKS